MSDSHQLFFFYVMFIKIIESEYLTGDKEVEEYVEIFKEVYLFNKLVYQKVINSTNIERISKFKVGRKPKIGFDL